MHMASDTVHLVSIAAPYRHNTEDMSRPPSALLYVGGALKKHGFKVRVHHIVESQWQQIESEILADFNVLWVGFSIITGVPVAASGMASQSLKAKRPDLPVVWGGVHPSIMPEDCLRYPFVDYAVIGEGELTAVDLSRLIANGAGSRADEIPGIAFRDNGAVRVNPRRPFITDLDDFRMDWSLVDIKRYVRDDGSFCFNSSRGCPHTCGFCYNQQFNLRRWRCHSADFVIEELSRIKEATGITSVSFDDDNFFVNRKRALEILQRLHEIGISCEWLEIRIDYLSERLLHEIVGHGVRSLFFGWESGSNTTLEKISKGFTRELILEKAELIGRYRNLIVDASAIIGFPWETEADVEETVAVALEMFRIHPFRLKFNLGRYIPYPGSPILAEAFERGFEFPREVEGWRAFEILGDSLRVPWLNARLNTRYTRIDRYAKLLYVPRHVSARGHLKALAAYGRLRSGFLALPIDAWFADYRRRRYQATL